MREKKKKEDEAYERALWQVKGKEDKEGEVKSAEWIEIGRRILWWSPF